MFLVFLFYYYVVSCFLGHVVEGFAVFLTQLAAVGQDVLFGGSFDNLLGAGDPFLLELVGDGAEVALVEVLA